MQKYFKEIEDKVKVCYSIAEAARGKGLDPLSKVEIPIARNLAERVIGLISVKYPQLGENVVKRIKELEEEFGLLDHAVSLKIAEEIAKEKFCKFKSHLEAIDAGIRAGFAYITVGVVASPLEGYTHFELKKTQEGKDYFCLYYSGPVRSAGGTGASFSVLIADHLREIFGYAKYDPTEEEVKRTITEIFDYHERISNLQYLPSEKEVEFLARNIPLQINGFPSEEKEVSNYRDLKRIETNFLRNGVALVLAEGWAQKAYKMLKILKKLREHGFKLSDWNWLEDFVALKNKEQQIKKEVASSATYISDLVAGRPVLGHPSKGGGFRLRYGKCRTSGLSSMAMHPFTMEMLKNYIAIGTQLKYEGPGKSSAMSPCDDIEGPIIKLITGSVVKINSKEKARRYKEEISEILFLGDFLVNYAEFFNRGKHLQRPGYCEEWYSLELEKAFRDKEKPELISKIIGEWRTELSFEEAAKISGEADMPLHPAYIFYWTQINNLQVLELLYYLANGIFAEDNFILPYSEADKQKFVEAKRALELIGIEHEVTIENLIIEKKNAMALLANLGVFRNDYNVFDKINLGIGINETIKKVETILKENKNKMVLDIINSLSKYKIKDKAGTFIGTRMGRPEKAKLRKLIGSPNVLFPVGEEGGRFRSVNEAAEVGSVKSDFPIYRCNKCNKETIYYICETCGNPATTLYYCRECHQKFESKLCPEHKIGQKYYDRKIDIKYYLKSAVNLLGLSEEIPDLIKGVKGTSNENHNTENLAKGILRAKHKLSVNKDGTIRYDVTEMPLTHFKPKEIGTGIERLKELGYRKDKEGNEITNENQIIELFSQDIILPACPESEDEKADDTFIRISKYLDELLTRFYNLKEFYKVEKREDLVGHLILGLAPHTSAAIIGRIIGFSKIQGCLAHPMWHAAQRRDCEGDETCIMFLLDALINFSKEFLPAHRGATQDAPLVATSKLIPAEIDDMAFDMDVIWKYPLELYEAAEKEKYPWEIKIEQLKNRLGTDAAYSNFGFTHNIEDLNDAVRYSAYKKLPTMKEKVEGQMWIAEKLRSVDQNDVARLIIDRHFIRDLRGNLRKFSQQQFRCVSCNYKFRRPPLVGKCTKCSGRIIFTVSYGSIVKYLEPAIMLAEKYNVPPYIKQSLLLVKRYIESIFGKETEKQEALGKWV